MKLNNILNRKVKILLVCFALLLVLGNISKIINRVPSIARNLNLSANVAGGINVEDLGSPFQTASLVGPSMFKDGNGDSHWLGAYTSATGTTQIMDVNLKTGNVNYFDTKQRGALGARVIYGNKLFMGFGQCTIFEYDTSTGAFVERRASNWAKGYCGTSSNETIAYSAYLTQDGMIYFGTAVRGTLFELNPSNGKIRDFGPVDSPASYISTMAVDANYVYAGMRYNSTNSWWLAIISRKDGSTVSSCWKNDKLNAGRVSVSVDGKEIWYGNNNGQYRIDNLGGKCPSVKGKSPALKPWFYPSNVYSPDADGYAQASSSFGFDINTSGMSADNSNNGLVTFKYRPSGSRNYITKTQTIKMTNAPIRRLKAKDANSLYIGSGTYGVNAVFDGKTKTSTVLGALPQSLYAITPVGQYVYFSGYTANTFRYTPSLPWTQTTTNSTNCSVSSPSNPCLAFGGMGKYHYFGEVASNGNLYIGSDYTRAGRAGGDIGWIDPSTGKTGSYPFTCDSPQGFALLADRTTIAYSGDEDSGSFGCTSTVGELYLFDTSNHKIKATLIPIPDAPDQGKIIGTKDGGILGIIPKSSGYTMYKVDQNGNHASWSPMDVKGNIFGGTGRVDRTLVRATDGMIYTWDSNGVVKINPTNGSTVQLVKLPGIVYMEIVGDDLYMATNNSLKRIKGISSTKTISSDALITSFSFNGLSPVVNGIIDSKNYTITLTVPFGTKVTNLAPTLSIIGASVSPSNNTTQNFTNSVKYTVTADDGTKQVYTVNVKIAPNTTNTTVPPKTPTTPIKTPSTTTDKPKVNSDTPKTTTPSTTTTPYTTTTPTLSADRYITSFSFNSLSPAVKGTFSEGGTISVVVPSGTNVTSLVPTITYKGASISPKSGIAQNFTSPVVYTVTAANGATRQYTIDVKVASGM